MDITSNELLSRKSVSEKGTSSEGNTSLFSACAETILSPGLGFAVSVGEKRKRSELGEGCNTGNTKREFNDNGDESVQPKISESSGVKFNDFDKLREDVRFTVGQIWALYDTIDGVPRRYALLRKVSAPSFGIRITYLEPDPDEERDIQWFEHDLPVSAGKFRLGKSQNTTDRTIISHVMHWNEGSSAGHLILSPRVGETWAIFKNWDINWSSEPDSHRKYEYEIVEILSGNTDGAGVSVAVLHKAKGFASVFFRMGTGDTGIFQIPSHSLYRFSYRIPSFRMKRVEIKGVPKYAYELDQAALPGTIEEKTVPPHLIAEPKQEALCFPSGEKVFQNGQIWSFKAGYNDMPRYFCKIQKITLTQEFEQEAEVKLHAGWLNGVPFAENVIQWEDRNMPHGCGTFLVNKSSSVFYPHHLLRQVVPQISMDGKEYTILPNIGEVWAIYRAWSHRIYFKEVERDYLDYDIVEVLDDASDFKVLTLEAAFYSDGDAKKKTVFRAAEIRQPGFDDEDGSEVVFTIPKSKMLRFSYQVPASRLTKEIDGVLKELFEVDSRALPSNVQL
ncbi:unnamed protein product [Microthlaspi erraticum]|uniref:DUF3444 domain-containing protein n=1 Tax=Microthlaspi erraticum TaxID=1685480 RepID=A0A6D2LKK4_9BRAS|nr:unnamed protein product [Microthlaspi erraticum]